MRLVGKVALVTGAQQGIGRAIALALGREGAHVVVNYLDDQAAAEATVADIERGGSRAVAASGSVAPLPAFPFQLSGSGRPEALAADTPCVLSVTPPPPSVQTAQSRATPCGAPR